MSAANSAQHYLDWALGLSIASLASFSIAIWTKDYLGLAGVFGGITAFGALALLFIAGHVDINVTMGHGFAIFWTFVGGIFAFVVVLAVRVMTKK